MENLVKQIVSNVMAVPVDSIHNDSSPESIDSWDSLRHMNLILALEQEFKVTFSEEQITEMMRVATIISTIKTLQ
ncbi:acyl carrier protein [Candidatus Magnetaquicoccus inordinatus]|uniref:acyl carrier protein n=1 Tax=Candidatus Magnetaquicoccus inordinatus TaxID=2496818 RepID=UPI00102B7493|nr:acyl carrier protein [Candidatus Magnetaquicoccus inordinatus]